MIRTLLFALCVGLWAMTPIWAEDWPEFRGPTGQGHSKSTKLPTQWSATKNIAWGTEIPGKGWSSPVIVEGKIYLTTAVPKEKDSKDLSLRALCLDSKTGKIEWDVEVFAAPGKDVPPIHNKNSNASPTPIVAEGKLYVHFGHLGTACLDLTGKILWTQKIKYAPVHGNGGSPILVDGKLIFSTDGAIVRNLIALDIKDGKEKWRTSRSGNPIRRFSFSTPSVITVNGKKQIISPGSDMVGAYNVDDGKELWRVTYSGYSVIPKPVFGHDMIFISTSYDSPTLMAIRVDGSGDVTKTHVVWEMKKGAPHTPSMLLVGDELYAVSDGGLASCVDAKTGKVHWQNRLGGRGYSATPLYADGKIWFLSEDGVATVIEASKEYKPLEKNEIGERTLASFAAAQDALFLRTASKIYRVGK